MIKSYIWTIANRFFHILLIASFALSYFLADFESIFYFHGVFGLIFLAGVIFRVIWGFIGTKHSRFQDFEFKGIPSYLLSILKEKKRFIGHNPASSLAIVLMLVLGVLCGLSGMLALGVEEKSGIFASLYFKYSIFANIKDLHEFFANALLSVVILHTCGALIDKFWNKNDSLDSILIGYKHTQKDESVRLNFFQKLFFGIYLIFLALLMIYLLYPKNIFLAPQSPNQSLSMLSSNALQDFTLYKKECGSCHIAYLPYLLSKQAWEKMMRDLENHFGDDASIDEEDAKAILAFLEKNALESFDTTFNAHLKQEHFQGIAFSQSKFFASIHRKIASSVFQSQEVKSKANCQSCHLNTESGGFQKIEIDFRKIK